MAAAGAVVAAALRTVRAAAAPGVSTKTLDEAAETVIREAGGIPSFLGYHGYPASICSSVNDRVVHGIPAADETLAPGDLVSIDCGAIIDGWHGDAAITFGVGTLIPMDEALSAATKQSMEAGIAAMVPGNRLTDVSHAIEQGTRAAERIAECESARADLDLIQTQTRLMEARRTELDRARRCGSVLPAAERLETVLGRIQAQEVEEANLSAVVQAAEAALAKAEAAMAEASQNEVRREEMRRTIARLRERV